ncbi:HAD hydrolase-like protein [Candidatus Micrarchaeota archaeon]|nr:HAD hydrolase-like protein [Candidatus Micrarchaeota archaeon]MBU1165504.1 HAD hydrolase-like protein [Candidatus Micrarchaeota archaeon]
MKTRFKCRIFDLDGTLYPRKSPLFAEIRKRTNEWLGKELGVTEEEAIRRLYVLKPQYPDYLDRFLKVGLSVKGYHEGVFAEISPANFLGPDMELRAILESLDGPNFVVSYAPLKYAELVLKVLGIRELIRQVHSIDEENHFKGRKYAEITAIESILPSEGIVFGDNFTVDLKPALELGMSAVIIGEEDQMVKLARFIDIREALKAID